MRTFLLLLVIAWAYGESQIEKLPESQQRALNTLKQLGAEVDVDPKAPGKPLTVKFTGSKITNEKMSCLKDLPQVCSVDL